MKRKYQKSVFNPNKKRFKFCSSFELNDNILFDLITKLQTNQNVRATSTFNFFALNWFVFRNSAQCNSGQGEFCLAKISTSSIIFAFLADLVSKSPVSRAQPAIRAFERTPPTFLLRYKTKKTKADGDSPASSELNDAAVAAAAAAVASASTNATLAASTTTLNGGDCLASATLGARRVPPPLKSMVDFGLAPMTMPFAAGGSAYLPTSMSGGGAVAIAPTNATFNTPSYYMPHSWAWP